MQIRNSTITTAIIGIMMAVSSSAIGKGSAVSLPSDHILTSVFHITTWSQTGTAFTIEVDRHQYLITAQHVVKDLKAQDKIKLCGPLDGEVTHTSCADIQVKVLRCEKPSDVAILVADRSVGASHGPLPPGT